MTSTDQKLDELKGKYAAVFSTIGQQGVSLSHVHVQDNKLYIAGTAKSEDAKNKIWDQIKQVNPNWQSEVICDLTVDPQAASSNTGQPTVQSGQSGSRTYTVQPGDSLSKISQQFYGKASEYKKIFEANRDKLSDPDKVQAGQVLQIPQ
ncbi:MAG: LysM peptidoglycan-binding domain-containing protein [Bryobacteraceae bacterium]